MIRLDGIEATCMSDRLERLNSALRNSKVSGCIERSNFFQSQRSALFDVDSEFLTDVSWCFNRAAFYPDKLTIDKCLRSRCFCYLNIRLIGTHQQKYPVLTSQ